MKSKKRFDITGLILVGAVIGTLALFITSCVSISFTFVAAVITVFVIFVEIMLRLLK